MLVVGAGVSLVVRVVVRLFDWNRKLEERKQVDELVRIKQKRTRRHDLVMSFAALSQLDHCPTLIFSAIESCLAELRVELCTTMSFE